MLSTRKIVLKNSASSGTVDETLLRQETVSFPLLQSTLSHSGQIPLILTPFPRNPDSPGSFNFSVSTWGHFTDDATVAQRNEKIIILAKMGFELNKRNDLDRTRAIIKEVDLYRDNHALVPFIDSIIEFTQGLDL